MTDETQKTTLNTHPKVLYSSQLVDGLYCLWVRSDSWNMPEAFEVDAVDSLCHKLQAEIASSSK